MLNKTKSELEVKGKKKNPLYEYKIDRAKSFGIVPGALLSENIGPVIEHPERARWRHLHVPARVANTATN